MNASPLDRRTLIVLGASARAAAWSAIAAGFAPSAIDLFADRDLAAVCPAIRLTRFPSDFAKALAAAPRAPWLYAGGLENHPRLVDRLARIRPLLGNGGDVLRRVRDVQHLADAAQAAGWSFPQTVTDRSPAAGAKATRQPGDKTWLLKPRRSGGGLGIRFASAADWRSPPRGTFLQEYIEGETASAVFVAAGGRAMLLGATRQLVGRDVGIVRPFLYAGSLGPLALEAIEQEALATLGNTLAGRFSLVGLFNVDFVRAASRLWLLEVNPRYSASIEIIERLTGARSIALHCRACEEASLPEWVNAQPARSAGKAVVYAERDCTAGTALAKLAATWNAPGQPPLVADLPHTGEPLAAGQPVVTVFADGQSAGEVGRLLRERAQAVAAHLRVT
jgi:predicted ATP-grasp superfamily ATP-dependent carboligase